MTDIIYPDKLKEIAIAEHESTTTPTKKVLIYGWDTSGLQKVRLKVDADGELQVDVLTLPSIPAGTNLIGRVSSSEETNTIYSGTTALTPKFAAIAAATSGDNTLVSAVTGKKIRVLVLTGVLSAATNIYFTSGAAGTVIFGGSTNKMNFAANSGLTLGFNPVGWFETAAGAALVVNLSAANSFSGGLVYLEV